MRVPSAVVCENHPDVEAVARCLICGIPLCSACAVTVDSHTVCAAHVPEIELARGQQPVLDLPRPDFTTRAIAYVTDGVVLYGIGAFMLSLVMALLRPSMSFNATVITHVVLFTAALALYTTYFIWKDGQTPAQALFHLRVVGLHGERLSLWRSFLRWVGYFISSLPLFTGFLVALKDPLGQGWHDKLAGTIVVGPSLNMDRKIRISLILLVVLIFEVLYALFTATVR